MLGEVSDVEGGQDEGLRLQKGECSVVEGVDEGGDLVGWSARWRPGFAEGQRLGLFLPRRAVIQSSHRTLYGFVQDVSVVGRSNRDRCDPSSLVEGWFNYEIGTDCPM